MRIVLLTLVLASAGCFGSTSSAVRNHYVLHGVTASSMVGRPIDGLVRVRNLDADTVYEKFQIVVRQNPYQLQYDEYNIWAVKPSQMIAPPAIEPGCCTYCPRCLEQLTVRSGQCPRCPGVRLLQHQTPDSVAALRRV